MNATLSKTEIRRIADSLKTVQHAANEISIEANLLADEIHNDEDITEAVRNLRIECSKLVTLADHIFNH